LTYDLVRVLLHECSSYSGIVIRRGVPLNVHLSITLEVVNAAYASSSRKRPSTACNLNSAAAEDIVARLGVDQNDVALIGLILQAETEHTDREATASGVPGSIGCRAGHSGCAYRESLARCHDLVVLVLADHCDAGQLSEAVTVKLTAPLLTDGGQATAAVAVMSEGQVIVGF
jgi:propanediol dehydratase large subunit